MSSGVRSNRSRYHWFRIQLFGAARISHAIAPRNGGVTNDAVTRARTIRRAGMSVRATSQPIGAATRQQITPTALDSVTVTVRGSIRSGSVNKVTKLAKVGEPLASDSAYTTSQNSGRMTSTHRNSAKL